MGKVVNTFEKNIDAKRILKLRKKMGMSQRALAKEFNVSPGAVAHWENGLRKVSGPILRLLEIYENCSTKEVLSGR